MILLFSVLHILFLDISLAKKNQCNCLPHQYEFEALVYKYYWFMIVSFFWTSACNYAKGKWVPDNNRPLYSGFGCKQWLSGMWACRLTQRTDFAYEKLRWQPKSCQMEEFEGSKFLRKYVIIFYLKFWLIMVETFLLVFYRVSGYGSMNPLIFKGGLCFLSWPN